MWRIVKVVLIVLSTTVLGWCAANSVYFAKPITARVVEAGTPIPLPGVTVVADWQLQGGMEGGRSMGHVAILETVTDADGRFAVPGWGPRFALPRGRLADRDPMLLFFKAGYFPKSLVQSARVYGLGTDIGLGWSDDTPGALVPTPRRLCLGTARVRRSHRRVFLPPWGMRLAENLTSVAGAEPRSGSVESEGDAHREAIVGALEDELSRMCLR